MRFVPIVCLLFFVLPVNAQEHMPDSTLKELARLTCECATLMKIDEGETEAAAKNLGTCINSTLEISVQNGWVKNEWMTDSVKKNKFFIDLENQLSADCPAFKALVKKFYPDAPDPLPVTNPIYYLTKEFMAAKGMELPASQVYANMHRWNAVKSSGASIQMVFDIRFVFKNEKEAAEYLAIKIGEMSEGGTLTKNNLQSLGTDESMVFGADPKLSAMFGDLDMAQYNFVFRIKNVVAKVFVATAKKTGYNDALVFAKEAIERIKAVK